MQCMVTHPHSCNIKAKEYCTPSSQNVCSFLSGRQHRLCLLIPYALMALHSNFRKFPKSVCCGARRLRLSNKRIQETLVDVSGGIEFLQAAGFQLAFEEDAQTQATEGCADLGTLRNQIWNLNQILFCPQDWIIIVMNKYLHHPSD